MTDHQNAPPLAYPIRVSREDLDHFERSRGFPGWGDEMRKDGLIEIVE